MPHAAANIRVENRANRAALGTATVAMLVIKKDNSNRAHTATTNGSSKRSGEARLLGKELELLKGASVSSAEAERHLRVVVGDRFRSGARF